MFDKVNERMSMINERDSTSGGRELLQGVAKFGYEVDKSLKMFETLVSNRVKEAIGFFGKSAKSLWMWAPLQDAKTAAEVTIGAAFSMMAVFKQVHHANFGILNRMGQTAISAAKPGRNVMPVGSLGATMGIAALMLYDWLSEQEELNLPSVGMIKSLNPGELPISSLKVGKIIVGAAFGIPMDGEDLMFAKDYFTKMAGIAMGKYSDSVDEYMPFLGSFGEFASAATNFGKIIANPVHYLGNMNEFDAKSKMYEAIKTTGRVPVIPAITGLANDNLKALITASTGVMSLGNYLTDRTDQNFKDLFSHTVGAFGSMVFGSIYMNNKKHSSFAYKGDNARSVNSDIKNYIEGAPEQYKPFGTEAKKAHDEYNSPSIYIQRMFKVLRIIDGDTIEVMLNGKLESIRVMDIDTAESKSGKKQLKQATESGLTVAEVDAKGQAAKRKLMEMILGQEVRLDIQSRGKYGRPLARVYLDEQNMGSLMMNQNLAHKFGSKDGWGN